MDLKKRNNGSYKIKSKLKINRILNGDLYIKRSLILKRALNKDKKIFTDYKLQRIKTGKNISNIKKNENSENSIDNNNNIHEKEFRRKKLVIELDNILEDNTRRTEKFVESFKELKEENNKFIHKYKEIKIPVEERIKRFIINSIKLIQNNIIDTNLNNKSFNNPKKDGEELINQNKAATKLFKQSPLIIKEGRDIYFYYIANHLKENINIHEHKYIKYLNQIKKYLDEIKRKNNSPFEKEEKKNNSLIFKEQQKFEKNDNNINIQEKPFNKVKSSKLILDEYQLNNNINDSRNKNIYLNKTNSSQEFSSKDTLNFFGLNNNENENENFFDNNKNINFNFVNENKNENNIINKFFKNVLIKNNTEEIINTPKNRNSYNIKLSKIYLNTDNNSKNLYKHKLEEKNNKCKSTKKLNFNINDNKSFQDTDYTINKIPSDNSTVKKNSKINMKKNISTKFTTNYNNFMLKNINKKKINNLFNSSKEINEGNSFLNIFDKNIINQNKSSNNLDKIIKVKEEGESTFNDNNNTFSIINLYEKTKKSKSLNKNNLEEINKYINNKGLKKEDILSSMKFNSDNIFVNLKIKTNRLNIEQKTKSFFYGIIPNFRKRKLEQLSILNAKINQIERDYIKTLIDKDLRFKK